MAKAKSLVILFFLLAKLLIAQNSKVGGIYFRVDDNQPIQYWRDYASIFNKYGFKFGFALNLSAVGNNPSYFQLIRDLQAAGHEMQDHTPNHRTLLFTDPQASRFLGHPAVDHVKGDSVCLKYINLDTTDNYAGEGNADIVNGNIVISKSSGAFKLYAPQDYYSRIYFPTLKTLCGFSKVFAANSSDVDTLYLVTPWAEKVNLPTSYNIPFEIIANNDIQVTDSGVELLGNRTLEICSQNNIARPYTWIQPGGLFTHLLRNQVKRIYGDKLGFTAGADTEDPVVKTYCVSDINNDNRFGWDWGDFNEEAWSYQKMRSSIADRIARHHIAAGHSHFISSLGGWSTYLARVDSLLDWCNRKKILVKTQNEWARKLYDLPVNPYENIIPPLNVDNDENGVPDGYYYQAGYTLGVIDTVDKVGNEYSYSTSQKGVICEVAQLGALEKGELDFKIWTKGNPGNTVQVRFRFPQNGINIYFSFPAESSSWKKYSLSQSTNGNTRLIVPDSVSLVDIFVIRPTFNYGDVKIGGMELKKKNESKVLKFCSSPPNVIDRDSNFYFKFTTESLIQKDSVIYQGVNLPNWLTLSADGLLSGHSPVNSELDKISIIAKDQFGYADTLTFDLLVGSTLLPIQLQSFTTIKNQNKIVLNWNTTTETDNFGFEVEKGENTTNWMKIGFVEGNGTTSTSHNYCFIDQNMIMGNYYRLKQSDRNGKITYSNSIVVEDAKRSDEKNLISCYPNPFNNGMIISLALENESLVSIEVFNTLGKSVKVITNLQLMPKGMNSIIGMDMTIMDS